MSKTVRTFHTRADTWVHIDDYERLYKENELHKVTIQELESCEPYWMLEYNKLLNTCEKLRRHLNSAEIETEHQKELRNKWFSDYNIVNDERKQLRVEVKELLQKINELRQTAIDYELMVKDRDYWRNMHRKVTNDYWDIKTELDNLKEAKGIFLPQHECANRFPEGQVVIEESVYKNLLKKDAIIEESQRNYLDLESKHQALQQELKDLWGYYYDWAGKHHSSNTIIHNLRKEITALKRELKCSFEDWVDG